MNYSLEQFSPVYWRHWLALKQEKKHSVTTLAPGTIQIIFRNRFPKSYIPKQSEDPHMWNHSVRLIKPTEVRSEWPSSCSELLWAPSDQSHVRHYKRAPQLWKSHIQVVTAIEVWSLIRALFASDIRGRYLHELLVRIPSASSPL